MTYQDLKDATLIEILLLPRSTAKWDERIRCNTVCVVPTGRLHDSGWNRMMLIAVFHRAGDCVELIDCGVDDIELDAGDGSWRIDCLPKSGLLQVWRRGPIVIGPRMGAVHLEPAKDGA